MSDWPAVILSRRDARSDPENYEVWHIGFGPAARHSDHTSEAEAYVSISKVRERLLLDEALDAAARFGWGERNWDDFTDGRKAEERVHFRDMFESALAAAFPEED